MKTIGIGIAVLFAAILSAAPVLGGAPEAAAGGSAYADTWTAYTDAWAVGYSDAYSESYTVNSAMIGEATSGAGAYAEPGYAESGAGGAALGLFPSSSSATYAEGLSEAGAGYGSYAIDLLGIGAYADGGSLAENIPDPFVSASAWANAGAVLGYAESGAGSYAVD